jgi:hypothetical protein
MASLDVPKKDLPTLHHLGRSQFASSIEIAPEPDFMQRDTSKPA